MCYNRKWWTNVSLKLEAHLLQDFFQSLMYCKQLTMPQCKILHWNGASVQITNDYMKGGLKLPKWIINTFKIDLSTVLEKMHFLTLHFCSFVTDPRRDYLWRPLKSVSYMSEPQTYPRGCLSSSLSTVCSQNSNTKCSRLFLLKTSSRLTRFTCFSCCRTNTQYGEKCQHFTAQNTAWTHSLIKCLLRQNLYIYISFITISF